MKWTISILSLFLRLILFIFLFVLFSKFNIQEITTYKFIQDNTENGIVVNLGTMVTIGGTTSELANSIFNNDCLISEISTFEFSVLININN